MNFREKRQIRWIFLTFVIMIMSLILLKYVPMLIYGKYILFDASAHVVFTSLILYIVWFFVDQNKNFRIPYLVFSFAVLIVISIQRLIRGQHNDVGLVLGFLISAISIIIPRWSEVKKKIDF